jgi:hypothetical protein
MRARATDPIASLTRRERRAWRRREQTILATHRANLAAALPALVGAPVLAVATGAAGTVTVTVPGWQVGLAGVSPGAARAFTRAAGDSSLLTGAGRYGRFWWLAVAVSSHPGAPRAVILGAWLQLHPADGAPTGLNPQPSRKEYSLP